MNFRLFSVPGDRGVPISVSAPASGPWIIRSWPLSPNSSPLLHTYHSEKKVSSLEHSVEGEIGPISQMRRLSLQEGRDLSNVIAQPNYLRQLEAREARLNSKDLLAA